MISIIINRFRLKTSISRLCLITAIISISLLYLFPYHICFVCHLWRTYRSTSNLRMVLKALIILFPFLLNSWIEIFLLRYSLTMMYGTLISNSFVSLLFHKRIKHYCFFHFVFLGFIKVYSKSATCKVIIVFSADDICFLPNVMNLRISFLLFSWLGFPLN